jgi:putative hemolysin
LKGQLETEPYHSILLSGAYINIYPLTLGSVLGLFMLVLLLICSALVSGSETAYFSLSANDKVRLKSATDYVSKSVANLLEKPNRLLATILIANNFVNIAIVILSTYITNQVFDFSGAPAIGLLMQVVAVAFLLIFFGEIIPKIYATGNPTRFAKFMSRGMVTLMSFFWPFSTLLLRINKRVKKYVSSKAKPISLKDLSQVLELNDETITEDKEILEGIVKFGKTFVKEVMKARIDVTAIDINMRFGEVISVITDSGFSRIPVYDETLDDIKGILYVKDLLPHLGKPDTYHWQDLVRQAYFIPDSKKINELLKEFQANKIHMALVIDEYGGLQGLVTLEDILEEIVGEIIDETDEDKPLFKKLDDENYLFEAKISLNDFYKNAEVPDGYFNHAKGDAETLAGLILELKGEIPGKNVKISYKNIVFEVTDVDNRRIRKVKVHINRKIQMAQEK